MGLVLYVLLAGCGPFDDAQQLAALAKAHIERVPEPPSHFADQPIPAALDHAVLRCLAKDPNDRFATASEMEAHLGHLAAAFDASAAMPPHSPTVRGPSAYPVVAPPVRAPQAVPHAFVSSRRRRGYSWATLAGVLFGALTLGALVALAARHWVG
jgi:serine/threonine protein kinase